MSNQRSRKVKMGSSRRRLQRTAILADDVTPKTETDQDFMTTVDTDSLKLDYSEHGNTRQDDFKEHISEKLHETREDIANASEKCRSSLLNPPCTIEMEVQSNQSLSVSQKTLELQKEDMHGINRTENLGMSGSNEYTGELCRELSENKAVTQIGMLPDGHFQETMLQMSKTETDNRTQEVSQCSGDDLHPRLDSSLYSHLPDQPFKDDMSNCPKELPDRKTHKGEHGHYIRKDNVNNLAVSLSPGTIAESQDYIFQCESVCGDVQSSIEKEHEVKECVNPLLRQFELPIQSMVCPLLIEVPSQEQMTNTTPDSDDATDNFGTVVEGQPLLTIQDTSKPVNYQEMTVPDNLEITKRDHIFDSSELEHNIIEKNSSHVCTSEGQASNKPWELMEDPAQKEREVYPLNIGALQSEYSSASADDEYPFLTVRNYNISFSNGSVGNKTTKQPITNAELIQPENNETGSEETGNLDSTIEFKDGCNTYSNRTALTELNPQSEDVPTSSSLTLSDCHSFESCLSTNMTDLIVVGTVSQHCPLSRENQCKSKAMNAPATSSQEAYVGVQTSTGISQSLGITEIALNESYLENENKNTVEMKPEPEEDKDFPQNSDGAVVDYSHLDKDVDFKLTEVVSNKEQDGDLNKKSSRKKRKIGSNRMTCNKGKRGGVDPTGEIVESDFSADLNMTHKSFDVETKCKSELLEGGRLGMFTDKGADCLFSIPPQSMEIKGEGSEDIIDKDTEKNTGGAVIHLPPESSFDDKDDRKEEESEEKCKIIEKIKVVEVPLFNSLPERNSQEISEEMPCQYHEEDMCMAATAPHKKDYIRPPGADFSMLAKEITPHSQDINSSMLFVQVSDIRNNEDNMDTAGQHSLEHSSNLDQISRPENQRSFPCAKDDDKHILRRRKMGSSRWTKGTISGSQKGLKEAHTKQDQEIESHAVQSEEDPNKLHFKDNKGAEKVVTDDNEPSHIDGNAHQSMSEKNISATQNIEGSNPGSTHTTFRMMPIKENIQDEQEVDSEVSEDRKIFKDELEIKKNKDNDTEQNGERSSETQWYPSVDTQKKEKKVKNSESEGNQVTGVKQVDTISSGLPSELYNPFNLEGRRRKMGSHRKSREQHYHDSEDQRAFGDHRKPTEPLSRQITGNATPTFDTSNKGDLRANCFNVVIVGSSNVGKTSFMKRVQNGSFSSDFSSSIGIDMCIHALQVDGSEVMLQLWDTAGQERFHSMSKQIFHKGQAFLLIYDITSFKSFSDVRYWISCIQDSAGQDAIMLLLGNKSDCPGRQVNTSEGQLLAKEYNIDFNECSAATGEHIVSSIEFLARMLTENYRKLEEGIVVQEQQKKSTKCC